MFSFQSQLTLGTTLNSDSLLPSAPEFPLETRIEKMDCDDIDMRFNELEREQKELEKVEKLKAKELQQSSSKIQNDREELYRLSKLANQKKNPELVREEPAEPVWKTPQQSFNSDRDELFNLAGLTNEVQEQQAQPQMMTQAQPAASSSSSAQTIPKTLDSGCRQTPLASYSNRLVCLPCDFCNKNIMCREHGDGSGSMREMIEHLETVHRQKMCPICSILFDMSIPVFDSYFKNHVQDHMQKQSYPKLDR